MDMHVCGLGKPMPVQIRTYGWFFDPHEQSINHREHWKNWWNQLLELWSISRLVYYKKHCSLRYSLLDGVLIELFKQIARIEFFLIDLVFFRRASTAIILAASSTLQYTPRPLCANGKIKKKKTCVDWSVTAHFQLLNVALSNRTRTLTAVRCCQSVEIRCSSTSLIARTRPAWLAIRQFDTLERWSGN